MSPLEAKLNNYEQIQNLGGTVETILNHPLPSPNSSAPAKPSLHEMEAIHTLAYVTLVIPIPLLTSTFGMEISFLSTLPLTKT